MTLAFVDTETTGLDVYVHEIWEVGLIVDEVPFEWHLPVDLGRADPIALSIGRFHDRHPDGNNYPHQRTVGDLDDPFEFCREFARLTHGRHLVGAVISFDEQRLRHLLRAYGVSPSWHYHLVDVEALAAGKLGGVEPPWDSTDLSNDVGVDPELFDRHTAIGDAEWAKAIYKACTR